MTERTKTHITILIDRSGSMEKLQSHIVDGVNNFIEDHDSVNCRTTVIQFDNQDPHNMIRNCKLKNWKPITETEFSPRGHTHLPEAMARAINAVERRDDTQQIFVIMATSPKNDSKEITSDALSALVKVCTLTDEMVFIYLGVDHDAFSAARDVGIAVGNAQNCIGDGAGVGVAYGSASTVSRRVRAARWKGADLHVADVFASTGTRKAADDDARKRSNPGP